MAKKKYTMSDLSFQAAQVKRTIISKARKGYYKNTLPQKTDVLKMISARLKITSYRSFYDNSVREEYLIEWFDKLIKQVLVINENMTTVDTVGNVSKNQSVEQLILELKNEKRLRKAYELRIERLMEENEELRVNRINMFSKIDS